MILAFSLLMAWGSLEFPAAQGKPVFRASVSVVRLDVSALSRNRPILGLGAADFEVLDNGVRQRLLSVLRERVPLDLMLVLDRSQSVEGDTLETLKEAARASLNALRDGDRAAVLTFAHVASVDAALGSHRAALFEAIDRLAAEGSTAALNATYAALSMSPMSERKTLVLLFSDGFDNSSWLTSDDVVRLAQESEAIVCAVSYTPPSWNGGRRRLLPTSGLLEQLSAASGGELVTVRDRSKVKETFLQIVESVRSRYVLSYEPAGGERAGWHDVRVRLVGRGGRVVVRPGYFAPIDLRQP